MDTYNVDGAEAVLMVTVCAWCGRRAAAERWNRLEADAGTPHIVTHGICPACLAEHVPGAAYPPA
jgi:hypothetical protein